jgi:hypothetical protein
VLGDNPRRDSVIFAVNVWQSKGPEPESIRRVIGRQKDTQYASRADSHIARQKQIYHLRLTGKLPPSIHDTQQARELASYGCGTIMHVVGLQAPRLDGEDHTKDIDFTLPGVRRRVQAGYEDTLDMIAQAPLDAADRRDRRRARALMRPLGIGSYNPARRMQRDDERATHGAGQLAALLDKLLEHDFHASQVGKFCPHIAKFLLCRLAGLVTVSSVLEF